MFGNFSAPVPDLAGNRCPLMLRELIVAPQSTEGSQTFAANETTTEYNTYPPDLKSS